MRTIVPKNARTIPHDATKVFSGIIFDVYQWDQKMFDGSTAVFEMLKRPDSVDVICVIDDKLVVLDEEQPNNSFFDLPGGRHDVEGETELQAIQRELREETGMVFKNWKLVTVDQPQSKIDWMIYSFIAWGLEKTVETKKEAGERITVKKVSVEEAIKLADDPKTRHLPKNILQKAGSIQGLIDFPEFKV